MLGRDGIATNLLFIFHFGNAFMIWGEFNSFTLNTSRYLSLPMSFSTTSLWGLGPVKTHSTNQKSLYFINKQLNSYNLNAHLELPGLGWRQPIYIYIYIYIYITLPVYQQKSHQNLQNKLIYLNPCELFYFNPCVNWYTAIKWEHWPQNIIYIYYQRAHLYNLALPTHQRYCSISNYFKIVIALTYYI